MSQPPLTELLKILQAAIRAVPPVKYALGIAGIASVLALIKALGISLGVAFGGTAVMLVLMTLLVVFARLTLLAKGSLRFPAQMLTWFSLVLLMVVSALLVACVFFRRPLDLSRWLDGGGRPRISLVALAVGPGTRPIAGLRFSYSGVFSRPTNDGGATELDLPPGYQAGRQIALNLVETTMTSSERWLLVNRQVNVPAAGEPAALFVMRRGEAYQIADEIRMRSAEQSPQAGEALAEQAERVRSDVAARHHLSLDQLQQVIASFGESRDPMDRGIALYLQGKYAQSEAILSDIAERKTHELVATLSYLGAAQYAEDKFTVAAETFRKALEVRPDDAELLNWLGNCLNATADWQGAEREFKRAIASDEQRPESEHANLARDLDDLAGVLQETGRLAEAETLMRRALAMLKNRVGLAHPNVAEELSNLASLLLETSRPAEAELLLRQALAIDERVYGPQHPEVATDLNNLGQLLQGSNRLSEAEGAMRRALAIDERRHGPEHSTVSRDLSNLARLLLCTNRLLEAAPYIRRALAIDEKIVGPSHPNVATRLNILSHLLLYSNRLAEAEPLMRRALAIDVAVYGLDNTGVATDQVSLARLLLAENRLVEAEPYVRQALAIDEKFLGPQHPSIATDLYILGSLLMAKGRSSEAEPLLQRALAIDEARHGPTHPAVARDLRNLAQLFLATNRSYEAEPLLRRALQIDENGYGPEHPDVAGDLDLLGEVLAATNRRADAMSQLRRALIILGHSAQLSGSLHPGFGRVRRDYSTMLRTMGRSPLEIDAALVALALPDGAGGVVEPHGVAWASLSQ